MLEDAPEGRGGGKGCEARNEEEEAGKLHDGGCSGLRSIQLGILSEEGRELWVEDGFSFPAD